jgi:endonuclease III
VRSRLATLVGRLRATYGPPVPPPAKNAFELVVWEKAAYLARDEKRAAAFSLLRRKIGVTPKKILAARRAELIDVLATGGIGAPERADNLARAAELVIGDFDGDLDEVCRGPLPEAKKQLMRIRGVGEPGAEKILLFTRSHAVMGLDSNALRVLGRLGYGSAKKTYTATYRSATAAALPELGTDTAALIDANLLLRAHGQRVCKTTSPRCGACVIRDDCPSAR